MHQTSPFCAAAKSAGVNASLNVVHSEPVKCGMAPSRTAGKRACRAIRRFQLWVSIGQCQHRQSIVGRLAEGKQPHVEQRGVQVVGHIAMDAGDFFLVAGLPIGVSRVEAECRIECFQIRR